METKREELPPHAIPAKATDYVAGFTEQQQELHELAVKMLGSSYFVERTHGFRKWGAANNNVKQPAK